MSLGQKTGYDDMDPNNIATKAQSILADLSKNLRVTRSHLSAKQFHALLSGKLDMEAFLKHVNLVDASTKRQPHRRFSRLKSDEDSVVKEEDSGRL
jgi:hypothetical protein